MDCPAVYMLENAVEHHVNAFFNYNSTRSAFAQYLVDEDHRTSRVQILHLENRYTGRVTLEQMEIKKH